MKLGIWTPLPHTIREEPRMVEAIEHLTTPGLKAAKGRDPSFEFALDVVSRAEKYGFDVTLVAERLMGPDLESWVLASAMAACTSSIELMVAVHPGIVPPQMVAKMGATLDRISNGRFSLNIINGWWKDEMNVFGNGAWLDDEGSRSKRMSEFVDVLRHMWAGDVSTYNGDFFTLDDARLPITTVQRPLPPIYAAARAPSGKDLVAQKCDTWFVESQTNFRLYEENIAAIAVKTAEMRDKASGYGRSLSFGLSAHVICCPTIEEALAQAEELEAYGKRDRVALIAANALGPGLIGTPEVIAERIDRYQQAGVDLTMVRFSPMVEGLDTFGQKVVPLLTRSTSASAA